MSERLSDLKTSIAGCQLCKADFAQTVSRHSPRPVIWLSSSARILIAGQAPGLRVHKSGQPFTDASGDRLRSWMGVSEHEFYDLSKISIVPMAFCFPGNTPSGGDLPPPKRCAVTWRAEVIAELHNVKLTLLVGGYAQKWHLGVAAAAGVGATVKAWRDHEPRIFALPHPSWRNSSWVKKNPWFETELLPRLRQRVREELND